MKRRAVIAVLCVVAIGALTFVVLRGTSGPPEPVYQGKTLSQWLSIWGPTRTNLTAQDSIECQAAVRAIGTNAIPFLLRLLATPDSPWKQRLADLAGKQKIVHINYVKPIDLRMRGQMGLAMLGLDAKSAEPELIRMYDSGVMPQANFANLLGNLGPHAKLAIPKILATSASATNDWERSMAINALGRIHSDASNVVPVLITYLADKSKMVQAASAAALGGYESNAKAAVPALVKLVEQDPPNNYHSAFPSGGASFLMQQPGAAARDALPRIDHEAYENFTRSKK